MIRTLLAFLLLAAPAAAQTFPSLMPDGKGGVKVSPVLPAGVTGALQLSSGTTAERPATPNAGHVRWNSQTSAFEFRTGAAWENPIWSSQIGSAVQAYDAELAALSGLTSGADKLPYFTGSGTAATTDLTSFGRSLIDDADATAARTTLGLIIGTNVQAYDSELAALASVTSAADKLFYFTGSGSATTTDLTSYARTLLDDSDAATARTTLGLGTIATQASNSVTITGGSITGITDLAVADGGTGASTAQGARDNLGLQVAYVSSQLDINNNSTSFNNVTLNRNIALSNGKIYVIHARLPYTSGSSGGVRMRLASGGFTGTINYWVVIYDGTATRLNGGNLTAVTGTGVAHTATTSGYIEIFGYAAPTANVNLFPTFCQSASNGTNSSILVGGTITAFEAN